MLVKGSAGHHNSSSANNLVVTVPADAPSLSGARPSADTVLES